MYNFTRHAIKLCSWNVYGLHENKLCDDILGAFLKLHDMIFVTETWASDEDSFNLDGYAYHDFSRKVKHTNAKRNSGGIGIFIRKDLMDVY